MSCQPMSFPRNSALTRVRSVAETRVHQTRARMQHTALCSVAQPGTSVQDSWTLLKKLTKADIRGKAGQYNGTSDARKLLREAVKIAAAFPAPEEGWDPSHDPPEILLGILSSDIRLAVRALRDWTSALHVPFVVPKSRVEGVPIITGMQGSVYVKYNALSQQCYVTQYNGSDRGVLLTFGGTLLGHLPLGLFDEQMQSPPPPYAG